MYSYLFIILILAAFYSWIFLLVKTPSSNHLIHTIMTATINIYIKHIKTLHKTHRFQMEFPPALGLDGLMGRDATPRKAVVLLAIALLWIWKLRLGRGPRVQGRFCFRPPMADRQFGDDSDDLFWCYIVFTNKKIYENYRMCMLWMNSSDLAVWIIATSRRNVTGMMLRKGNHSQVALLQLFSGQWIGIIQPDILSMFHGIYKPNYNCGFTEQGLLSPCWLMIIWGSTIQSYPSFVGMQSQSMRWKICF
jgi:hypothetical protein